MPFAEKSGFITGFLKEFGKGRLRAVKGFTIHPKPVDMAVLSGKYDCPAWSANRVCTVIVVKKGSIVSNPIDVRSGSQLANGMLIGTDGLSSMVVSHDENNIGLFGFDLFRFFLIGFASKQAT